MVARKTISIYSKMLRSSSEANRLYQEILYPRKSLSSGWNCQMNSMASGVGVAKAPLTSREANISIWQKCLLDSLNHVYI